MATTKYPLTKNAFGNQEFNTINFINQSLRVFNGKQYCVFTDADAKLMVGKRTLGSDDWVFYDTGNTTDTSDLHNNASMGISPDGIIHISFNQHDTPLKYIRSNNPENPTSWTTLSNSMVGQDEALVTYPQFFTAQGTFFFTYRQTGVNAGSVDGYQHINKWNPGTKTWSIVQHPIITGEGNAGIYCDNFAVDKNGYVHCTFIFRRTNQPSQGAYSYAMSKDGCVTWQKTDGTPYTLPIIEANSEKFDPAQPITQLINQNKLDIDGDGHPHIAYWKLAGNQRLNYYHAWHNGSTWSVQQVTNHSFTVDRIYGTNAGGAIDADLSRAGMVIRRSNNALYLFTRPGREAPIIIYVSYPPYTDFRPMQLGPDRWGWTEFGGIDMEEWHRTNKFYFLTSNSGSTNPANLYILESDLNEV